MRTRMFECRPLRPSTAPCATGIPRRWVRRVRRTRNAVIALLAVAAAMQAGFIAFWALSGGLPRRLRIRDR